MTSTPHNAPEDDTVNVSSYLTEMARIQPYKRAVVSPAGRDAQNRIAYVHLTFRQLDQESDCLAAGLENAGITRGTKTILMVRPGIEFFALTPVEFLVPHLVQSHYALNTLGLESCNRFVGAVGSVSKKQITFLKMLAQLIQAF